MKCGRKNKNECKNDNKTCEPRDIGSFFSKPNPRDSLGFVHFTTIFHLNLKPRCTICFWAFWPQLVPYSHFALVLLIKWHHLLIVVEFKNIGRQISTSVASRWLEIILIWACSEYVFLKAIQSCWFSLWWGFWFMNGRSGIPMAWNWRLRLKSRRFWYLLVLSNFVTIVEPFDRILFMQRPTSLCTYFCMYVWLYGYSY